MKSNYHQCAWEQTGDLFAGGRGSLGGIFLDEVNCCGRELNVYSIIGSPYYHQSMHTADGPVSVHGLTNNKWAIADSTTTTGLFGAETYAFYDSDVPGVASGQGSLH